MYNFDEENNRFNTYSLKWDVKENELPMWVADMDFKTLPEVISALQEVASKGIFGYSIVCEEFFDAIIYWWEKRHHYLFKKENMIFTTGIVAAISSMVRKLTSVGENVLIQSPVYNIFYNSIYNNGRNIISNDLVYENGTYHIDFDDLEKKLANPQTSLMILCNPHNPIGKIWTKDELARIGHLCKKYNVIVISDEIHCDLCIPGCEYTPFFSASEECEQIGITCVAASKTFNLAGLQSACVIVNNPYLRHKVYRGVNTDEVAEPNIFAMKGNIAAFKYGEKWVNELNEYLYNNRQIVFLFLKEKLPHLYLVPSEATYLLWIDVSYYSNDSITLCDYIRKETGLYLSDGNEYGQNGCHFIRMNIATTSKRVEDGLKRLKLALDKLAK